MYLAIQDEGINEKQRKLQKELCELADRLNKISFWKRWLYEDKIIELCWEKQMAFERWMDRRIREQNRLHNLV